MKNLLFALVFCCSSLFSQEMPTEMATALKNDNVTAFEKLVNKDNMNTCFGKYSILSGTVRYKAQKCFNYLIEKGVDVNKSCAGYVPPLMHAAKYGMLEMVKTLVAKGADLKYVYHGDYEPAEGHTPLTYAEAYEQTAVVEYLKTVSGN